MKHLLLLGVAFAAFHISHSQLQEFCGMKTDEGHGESYNFALFYNLTADTCQPFIYRGEGGNNNRFYSDLECIRNCSINKEKIYPMEANVACHFPKAIGPCNARILSYYYDPVHDKCKKFLWSGCNGNGNRFPDQATCNNTCAGIHDDGDTPEEDDTDTPIAIICGVLLASIIVSVFVTMIVLTIKSKKKEAKKKEQNSKEAHPEIPLQDYSTETA